MVDRRADRGPFRGHHRRGRHVSEIRLTVYIECLDCGRKLEDQDALTAHGAFCAAMQAVVHVGPYVELFLREGVTWVPVGTGNEA